MDHDMEEDEPVRALGRREMDEESSEYEPSSSSEEEEEEEAAVAPSKAGGATGTAGKGTEVGKASSSSGSDDPDSDSDSDSDTDTDADSNTGTDGTPSTPQPSRKRALSSADGNGETPKRQKTAAATAAVTPAQIAAYRRLLRADAADAALQYARDDAWPPLAASQAGLVAWTADEKAMLFEAVGRVGRDDLPQLAARVQTKDAVAVRQYLQLVDDAVLTTTGDTAPLALADIPAAAEISEAACAALERVADAVAAQDAHDDDDNDDNDDNDASIVGGGAPRVLLTKQNVKVLTRAARASASSPDAAPLLLLRAPLLLRLAARVFMNGPLDPDGGANWRSVQQPGLPVRRRASMDPRTRTRFHGSQPPALRAAALAGLHTLVRARTQQLVAAALHVARSRVRARHAGQPRLRGIVRRRDVAAAVAMLGWDRQGAGSCAAFWARCPRRLRLQVYGDVADVNGDDGDDDGDDQKEDDDADDDGHVDDDAAYDGEVLLTYDQVEAALLPRSAHDSVSLDAGGSDEDEDVGGVEDDEDTDTDSDTDSDIDSDSDTNTKTHPDPDAAADAAADTADRHASSLEELYLWDLLGRAPRPAQLLALETEAAAGMPSVVPAGGLQTVLTAMTPTEAIPAADSDASSSDDDWPKPDWRAVLAQEYHETWEMVAAEADGE